MPTIKLITDRKKKEFGNGQSPEISVFRSKRNYNKKKCIQIETDFIVLIDVRIAFYAPYHSFFVIPSVLCFIVRSVLCVNRSSYNFGIHITDRMLTGLWLKMCDKPVQGKKNKGKSKYSRKWSSRGTVYCFVF